MWCALCDGGWVVIGFRVWLPCMYVLLTCLHPPPAALQRDALRSSPLQPQPVPPGEAVPDRESAPEKRLALPVASKALMTVSKTVNC